MPTKADQLLLINQQQQQIKRKQRQIADLTARTTKLENERMCRDAQAIERNFWEAEIKDLQFNYRLAFLVVVTLIIIERWLIRPLS